MRITAIIVNYKTPHLVLKCLEALAHERDTIKELRAVVVDNASNDGSEPLLSDAIRNSPLAEWVDFLPLPLNGGFGWGNNQAMLHVIQSFGTPDAFYLLNPDALVQSGALKCLSDCLYMNEKAGAAGSQLLNTDGTLAASAFRFPTVPRQFIRALGLNFVGRLFGIRPIVVAYGTSGMVDWVTGASILIRTKALEECGLFDTGFFLYYEEVELLHRFARAGWLAYHCTESRVMHIAGASTGVVNGKTAGTGIPPEYLFKSRRRYFALTGGRMGALVAGLAWLAGCTLRQVLDILRGKSPCRSKAEVSIMLRVGLRAQTFDTFAAFERTNAQVGQIPFWMCSSGAQSDQRLL